ncbi:RICIN domain-containing protein [Lentzea sp. DG1S-22]|uniref:RICIN domain-containing protein n=1 Tax=Lentzea sp. DG1S-22 TaxID=3108822 RepID=UPI002E77120E|nr:RICIN domain-containing protein [Lentzea sp. DG1S-22]WVH80453.1 RICIN domain-containing protein [Lentzea sp. DG1S-22]
MGKLPAALGAVVLLAAVLVVPARASAEPVTFPKLHGSGRGGTISLPGTGRCLDAALEEIDRNGGKVQMWTCGLAGDEQQWRYDHLPDIGAGAYIVSQANGKCLEVAPEELGAEGGRLQMWDCTGRVEQRWEVIHHQGDLFLTSKATRGVLGVWSVHEGAPIGVHGKS